MVLNSVEDSTGNIAQTPEFSHSLSHEPLRLSDLGENQPIVVGYYPTTLFIAVVGDGVAESSHEKFKGTQKIVERCKGMVEKIPREQCITVDLPGEGLTELKLRVYIAGSDDAKMVETYAHLNPDQIPAPFIILTSSLPVAGLYNPGVVDPYSSHNTAEKLRKQAKLRAVRFVREAILDQSVAGLSLHMLRGFDGAYAAQDVIHSALLLHTVAIPHPAMRSALVFIAAELHGRGRGASDGWPMLEDAMELDSGAVPRARGARDGSSESDDGEEAGGAYRRAKPDLDESFQDLLDELKASCVCTDLLVSALPEYQQSNHELDTLLGVGSENGSQEVVRNEAWVRDLCDELDRHPLGWLLSDPDAREPYAQKQEDVPRGKPHLLLPSIKEKLANPEYAAAPGGALKDFRHVLEDARSAFARSMDTLAAIENLAELVERRTVANGAGGNRRCYLLEDWVALDASGILIPPWSASEAAHPGGVYGVAARPGMPADLVVRVSGWAEWRTHFSKEDAAVPVFWVRFGETAWIRLGRPRAAYRDFLAAKCSWLRAVRRVSAAMRDNAVDANFEDVCAVAASAEATERAAAASPSQPPGALQARARRIGNVLIDHAELAAAELRRAGAGPATANFCETLLQRAHQAQRREAAREAARHAAQQRREGLTGDWRGGGESDEGGWGTANEDYEEDGPDERRGRQAEDGGRKAVPEGDEGESVGAACAGADNEAGAARPRGRGGSDQDGRTSAEPKRGGRGGGGAGRGRRKSAMVAEGEEAGDAGLEKAPKRQKTSGRGDASAPVGASTVRRPAKVVPAAFEVPGERLFVRLPAECRATAVEAWECAGYVVGEVLGEESVLDWWQLEAVLVDPAAARSDVRSRLFMAFTEVRRCATAACARRGLTRSARTGRCSAGTCPGRPTTPGRCSMGGR